MNTSRESLLHFPFLNSYNTHEVLQDFFCFSRISTDMQLNMFNNEKCRCVAIEFYCVL